MTLQEIYETLRANFSDAIGSLSPMPRMPFILVEAANIKDVCLFLRDEPGFSLLADVPERRGLRQ